MNPTLAGFIAFIRGVMGITVQQLPDNSPAIPVAYNVATAIVNRAFQAIAGADPAQPSIYALMVYNLAGDNLVNYAPDQDGQTFFADLRKSLNIAGFVGGIIQSSGDEGTSEAMVVPEAFKLFTMANLQQLKTPWGRQYLSFAQSYGYLVGLS